MMMLKFKRAGVAFLAVVVAGMWALGPALGGSLTPPPGSGLRRAVLDGLRPMVGAEVGLPVEFVVEQLNVLGEWAFVKAVPQRPGGGAIGYAYSRYQAQVDSGAFSGLCSALLRQTPDGWLVYGYDLGGDRDAWAAWATLYPVPAEVFHSD